MSKRGLQRAAAGLGPWAACLLVLAAPPPASGQSSAAPPPVVVGLPVPQINAAGELVVQPNVVGGRGSLRDPQPPHAPASRSPWPVQTATALQGAESLPPPAPGEAWPGGSVVEGQAGKPPLIPEGFLTGDPIDMWMHEEPVVPWDEMHGFFGRPRSPNGQPGLGRERLATAPFEIDIAQPQGNFLLRADAAYNLTKPDRAELFWASPARGPGTETSVDYQDLRFVLELGTDAFSLATEIPVRFVDPEFHGNTGGVGDIQLVQKTVLMNGYRWQISQLLRTVFNSGNARKGLGTGHVSMEPGVLCRFEYSELTHIHSEFKLMFPLGADPAYAGPAFKWGIGASHIWWETDTTAWIPTLEFTNIWILDGQWTPFPAGPAVDVDGDGIFNLAPGLRVAIDTGGDLGIVEIGAAGILAVGSDGWYDSLVRFDLRFVF